jgi:RHS repeat-associated protein
MSVPIATSPGRSGFGPQLSVSYDSGSGNGPFGFGWSLSLPQITRKTDKGLPLYHDTEQSDVFLLSGAEDLVPLLQPNGSIFKDETTVQDYTIHRYRPRIEGLFARIERWTHVDGHVHWRSISRDNILTIYGKDSNSRIADPADDNRIFTWLMCETRDDKGNAILYEYKKENGAGVDLSQAHEGNRGDRDDTRRQVNRYLKRVRYGNRVSLLDNKGKRPRFLLDNQIQSTGWMFEVVFDYGEHDEHTPHPGDGLSGDSNSTPWPCRDDPFSSYRAGFEVRTYRLCRRVLMFHHFPDEEVDSNCLVRSTNFSYSSKQDLANTTGPVYTFLDAVTQYGYKRLDGSYLKRSLPPVAFEYTKPIVQDLVEEVDPASLENLPIGVDGTAYQWTDLHGEGIPGILTEQAGAWFYKRNISPISDRPVEFTPLERVALKPNLTLAGSAQFIDLAGDGLPDLVVMDHPVPGFYEHDTEEGWQSFRPFTSRLNREMRDPNLKFIDLDGDGHADVLISEDDAFVWHRSLAEEGFGPARRVAQALDEEKGPRLVFADSTQSIYLADLSGDGLTDLVRIRNGEVCYWPNLGYCRFGAKITMDHAPYFDHPDQFEHKRIRLADIDGTGTTDIIYLHGKGVRLYFNQSGNSWSKASQLNVFPRIDDLVSIMVTDLLGNGTACLVWSSSLPGDVRQPMRYVNLMGGQKPHLLVKTINNLGAETLVQYASSIKFYLRDKQAGKPWITKLPFPVHCVEKVTINDKWRGTSFSTTYSYHHGYFDGAEREFRGFGRVEQVDVEDYGTFAKGNANSPYITEDQTLYQPPVKTVTWFHTGAYIDRRRILSQFEHEYFPHWFDALRPSEENVLGDFQENILPEPDLETEALTSEEWREALRACKGMMLRQEIYELDVDALSQAKHQPVKLFSTAYHNCHIRRLQPRGNNRHAVFLVAESEAISYHYELDLTQNTLNPAPRIAHTLNLKYDDYANVLQSVAVVYPRRGQFEDDSLKPDELYLIRQVQRERHLAYTETRYTEDFGHQPGDEELAKDNHRLRLPCEVLTYELTGISPEDEDDSDSNDPRDNLYFTLDELRCLQLSGVYQPSGAPVAEIAYHQRPPDTSPHKRLVKHVRMLFFKDDTATLDRPLPLGRLGRLGLPYETYTLALTTELLDAIFKDEGGSGNKLDQTSWQAETSRQILDNANLSGYLSGEPLAERFADVDPSHFTELNTTGQYWIRSGIAGFAGFAAQHFYLPERYTDPFGNITTLEYDPLDLYIKSSTDHLDNRTEVTRFDYRVLSPSELKDINDNLSEVLFDTLGMPTAMAVKGKATEGDNLNGFDEALIDPDFTTRHHFFVQDDYDPSEAESLLGNATARHIYFFGETRHPDGSITWADHPACASTILRERHLSQLKSDEKSSLQAGFEYSDGLGNIVVKKIQAEPEAKDEPLRWIASGKTILNNKGKPVKQYEPYFSPAGIGHRFEEPMEAGVTPVMFYDAAGHLIRTEMPDGTHSRVEFTPWSVRAFDQNDTVLDSNWYTDRNPPELKEKLPTDSFTGKLSVSQDQRAAWLTAQHANTPALTILDSLGRNVIAIAHNRVEDVAGTILFNATLYRDEKYLTFTKLDAEGKPLWIRDARNNLVMQYLRPVPVGPAPEFSNTEEPSDYIPAYDIAGNLLFQHSMDAGDRWMLNDAAGKPLFAWDSRGHSFRTEYDRLHRPTESYVKGADPQDPNRDILFEKLVYGDTQDNGLTIDETKKLNLRGKLYQHYDTAGIVINKGVKPTRNVDEEKKVEEAFDFKGNLLRSTRRLLSNYKDPVDWSPTVVASDLEAETFISSTRYDALNRPIQIVQPHIDQTETDISLSVNIIRPSYNEANLLERIDVWLAQAAEPMDLDDLQLVLPSGHGVKNIDYNAKGQRVRIDYGNGASTLYDYDEYTFRLSRLRTLRGRMDLADCSPVLEPRICEDPPANCSRLSTNKCILQDLNYTYDPVGNITHIRDAAQQIIFFRNAIVEPSNDYSYDALYRLIDATGREHLGQNQTPIPHSHDDTLRTRQHPNDGKAMGTYVESYQYDGVGNILAMRHRKSSQQSSNWKRCYQYAQDSNRLLSTSNPTADSRPDDPFPEYYSNTPIYGDRYEYDAHGNMTCMPHLPLMQWDFKDQLQAISKQVVNTTTSDKVPETTYYVYDATGQRMRKVKERNGIRKEERIYLGGFEIYRTFNNNGKEITLERETLHIMDDKQRIALVERRTSNTSNNDRTPAQLIRYQFGNHLGSASLELDHDAKIISYEEYTPYGSSSYQAVGAGIETPKRYRYTGKERDEESGLYYHGARYYAPWLGRWCSCDRKGMRNGHENLYVYVLGNPVIFRDPTGNEEEESVISEVVKGDFHEGKTTWTGVLLNVGVGMIPVVGQVADARDTIVAVKNVWNDPESGGNWGLLGMAAVGWVPIVGDALKGSGKVVKKASKELLKEGTEKLGKETIQGVEKLGHDSAKEGMEKLSKKTEQGVHKTATSSLKVPQRGTKEWIAYASKTWSGRFSESPQLSALWKRATKGVDNWDIARENFWKLVKNDSSQEAATIRDMLKDSGCVFRKNLSDGTAPVLSKKIPKFTEDAARKWAGSDPKRQEIIERLIESRNAGKVPKSDISDRLVSIDHELARANEGSLLAPDNLRLMFLRDNVFKGAR